MGLSIYDQLALRLLEQPVSGGIDVEEFSRRSHVVLAIERQEGDIADLTKIVIDLFGQLFLLTDREDERWGARRHGRLMQAYLLCDASTVVRCKASAKLAKQSKICFAQVALIGHRRRLEALRQL